MAKRDLFTRIRKRPAAMVAAGALMMGGLVAVPAAMAGTTPPYTIYNGSGTFAVDVADGLQFPDAFLDDEEGNIKELGPSNGSSTKLGVIHTAAVPMLGPTNPNAQVDLRGAWIDTKKDTDGDQWLYFAWERDSSNGSGIIMYEFQQDPVPAECDYTGSDQSLIDGCNPWKNRKPGDFILVWDQQGTTITILKRVFDGTAFEPAPGTALGSAKAAVSPDGFFGEAAINLTTDVFDPENPACTSYANIIPGTVTGNSDTADYKDTILEYAPTISNCGTIKITKDAKGEAGTFEWTLARESGNIHYEADDYSGAQLTTESRDISDTETHTVEDLIEADNYTLVESTIPFPFELESIRCEVDEDASGVIEADEEYTLTQGGSFPVIAGETTFCTIVNDLQDGTLVVNKVVVTNNGGDGTTASDFTFKVNGGDDQMFDEEADEDGDPETGTWSQTYTAGTQVNVVENDYSPAWATTYSDDYDGNDPEEGQDPAECLGLVIPAGGTVTCTITNDDQQGTLIVNKVVVNNFGGDGTAGDFTFKVNNGDDQPFDEEADEDGDPKTGTWSQAVDAGTYSVVENDPSGLLASYSASYADNDADNDAAEDECVNMTVGLGETVTCTITNTDSQNSPGLGQTVQSWVLRDSFSLTGIRPGADDQNDAYVTFRLFESWDGSSPVCTDQVGEAITVDASASDYSTDGSFVRLDLAMADSQGIEVFESGPYYWTAEYSGDAYNAGSTTLCGDEKTLIQAKDQFIEETEPSVVYRDDFTP